MNRSTQLSFNSDHSTLLNTSIRVLTTPHVTPAGVRSGSEAIFTAGKIGPPMSSARFATKSGRERSAEKNFEARTADVQPGGADLRL